MLKVLANDTAWLNVPKSAYITNTELTPQLPLVH